MAGKLYLYEVRLFDTELPGNGQRIKAESSKDAIRKRRARAPKKYKFPAGEYVARRIPNEK